MKKKDIDVQDYLEVSTHMIIMVIRQAIVTEVCLVDSIITIIRRTGIC